MAGLFDSAVRLTYTNAVATGRRCPECGDRSVRRFIEDNSPPGCTTGLYLCLRPVSSPEESTYYGLTEDVATLATCGAQWDAVDYPDELEED